MTETGQTSGSATPRSQAHEDCERRRASTCAAARRASAPPWKDDLGLVDKPPSLADQAGEQRRASDERRDVVEEAALACELSGSPPPVLVEHVERAAAAVRLAALRPVGGRRR